MTIENDHFTDKNICVLTKSSRVQEKLNQDPKNRPSDISAPYLSNTRKESVCLELLKLFLESYFSCHKPKKNRYNHDSSIKLKIFFSAKNEYGIEKCVCTTIRPTLLPYAPLYDYATCASFIAHYLEYEPFEPSQNDSRNGNSTYDSKLSLPSTSLSEFDLILPSPTQVLEWCSGDCFDFATVLVSLLLGSGYDAYVVYGLAPRWVCDRDQTVLDCPYPKNECSDKNMFSSSHNHLICDEDHQKCREKNNVCLSKDSNGIHAWVLIRAGKRGMKDMIFVEPSTGETFLTGASPYIQITSVWNADNYWINRQISDQRNLSKKEIDENITIKKLSFDLSRRDLWIPVFPDEFSLVDSSQQTIKDTTTNTKYPEKTLLENHHSSLNQDNEVKSIFNEISDKNKGNRRYSQVPCSWVDPLIIPRELYEKKYQPNGKRVILYRKAKLELYAEGVNNEGLLSRVTTFCDLERNELLYCREKFVQDRYDRLYERRRYPLEMRYEELFSPGNRFAMKRWFEEAGSKRVIEFYPNGRVDCLKCYEEHSGDKSISYFEGRFDNLIYRSVYFEIVTIDGTREAGSVIIPSVEGGNSLMIVKIVEQYQATAPPTPYDVAKRTFHLQGNKIDTEFYNFDHVTKNVSTHFVTRSRDVATPIEQADMESANKAANAEKKCLVSVRAFHQEITEIVRIQRKDYERVRTNWATQHRNKGDEKEDNNDTGNQYLTSMKNENKKTNESKKEKLNSQCHVDFLSPFMINVVDSLKITQREAISIRDSCLNTLKDRLLERANIIQNRLNNENTKLSQHQAEYQQIGKGKLSKEEFEKICSEATFRIKVLEQRLVQHEDAAVAKYKALEEKILSDPRMSPLHEK